MAANEPDMTLLGELYEEIDRNPPAIMARKLLVEQFIAAGWMDSVREAVEELYSLDSFDEQIKSWHLAFCQIAAAPPSYQAATSTRSSKSAGKRKAVTRTGNVVAPAKLPTDAKQLENERSNLMDSYRLFQNKARSLLRDFKLLQSLQPRKGVKAIDDEQREQLEALADGRITTFLREQGTDATDVKTTTYVPESARAVAQKMKVDTVNAFNIVMVDLEAMVPWLKSIWQKPTPPTEDDFRDLILKRVRMIVSCLPPDLAQHAQTAFMHMEHEQFKRKYVNDETMYGENVSDIPRKNFLATEDNYAWDMEELSAAIEANKGVMRNPLSKFMFTPADIKAILRHPTGRSLAALEVEQSRLKRGVRDKTINEMERVAQILLVDMDESAKVSREALDEFTAYIATLPQKEQDAIDNLRVPAKDSHTGHAFDGSIGDTLRDAISNKLCFHKAGEARSFFFRLRYPIVFRGPISTMNAPSQGIQSLISSDQDVGFCPAGCKIS